MSNPSIPSSGQDPPKKVSWTKRVICFFLPKRFHKYVTPEGLVLYNVGSNITWVQAFVLFQWEKVSTIFMTKVLPVLEKLGILVKGVTKDLLDLFSSAH